jgi:sugar (pentulose or hexulose) kinase
MMPPYPPAVPDQYYSEINVMRGLWMVTWFKEEFGLQERLESMETNISPEELLENLIKDVPPGSMGLMLQPYWTPGPDMASCSKGSIIGFGDVHTRAHLYRAIIEGLVYALKEGGILTEKKNKIPFKKIRISGGGSQSDAIAQITADVFGLTVERPHTHETSVVGAAMNGAVGLGIHPDIETAVKEMTRVGDVFLPIPENVELYGRLFENVYKKIYKKLLPLFKEIREITRYPEFSDN